MTTRRDRADREQADAARLVLQFGGQFRGEDRDEDHVVDAEHDLQCEEGGERGPRGGVREPVHSETVRRTRKLPPDFDAIEKFARSSRFSHVTRDDDSRYRNQCQSSPVLVCSASFVTIARRSSNAAR
jgi:hypothetical protein